MLSLQQLRLIRLLAVTCAATCAAGAKGNRMDVYGLNNSATDLSDAWIQLHKTAIVAVWLYRTTQAYTYN